MPKILIIEDDVEVAERIEAWLRSQSYVVEKVVTGKEALERLRFYEYDVILLDLNIPSPDGIQVCKQFRDTGGKTPILMLTGRDRPSDKVRGLDAGADDYLSKPFDTAELNARLRALMRRPSILTGTKLTSGDLLLDPVAGQVTKGGLTLELQPMEYALLEFFMRHSGVLLSTEMLLARVWGADSDATVETLRTYVKTLRKKIDSSEESSLISTVYGVGYRFEVSTDNRA
jgi:DNA-binding response OmpR family regulator